MRRLPFPRGSPYILPMSDLPKSDSFRSEPSRYLAQHVENPVAWRSWGEPAFAEARSTEKPLFVSIGYSSCHWCHVMAHESFEDPETAAVINELFIPVKVDKEEYPDVDGYYMSFLTQLSGSGGWPLNVLLNPNLAPFYGFTYLPTESLRSTLEYCKAEYDKHERIRLQEIRTAFHQKPVDAGHVRSKIADLNFESPTTNSGAQFPQPLYLALAAEYGRVELVRSELSNLITRGLFDHIEGGWFRYSVDPKWKVPHFEKMLYDQATLLYLCGKAYRIEPELCGYAIESAVSWLDERMRLTRGLYGSATDADTGDGEGTYYTFEGVSSQEEAELFMLTECGVHEERYLPWIDAAMLREKPKEAAGIIRERKHGRTEFEAPGLDTKAVFSWNAFLGCALFECFRATGDESLRTRGNQLLQALETVGKTASDGLPHVTYPSGETRGNRYLQDYAALLLLRAFHSESAGPAETVETRFIEEIESLFVGDGRLWHTDRREFESQSLWQDTPFPSGGSILLNATSEYASTADTLSRLLNTNIIDVASDHSVFFPFWLSGYRRREASSS